MKARLLCKRLAPASAAFATVGNASKRNVRKVFCFRFLFHSQRPRGQVRLSEEKLVRTCGASHTYCALQCERADSCRSCRKDGARRTGSAKRSRRHSRQSVRYGSWRARAAFDRAHAGAGRWCHCRNTECIVSWSKPNIRPCRRANLHKQRAENARRAPALRRNEGARRRELHVNL